MTSIQDGAFWLARANPVVVVVVKTQCKSGSSARNGAGKLCALRKLPKTQIIFSTISRAALLECGKSSRRFGIGRAPRLRRMSSDELSATASFQEEFRRGAFLIQKCPRNRPTAPILYLPAIFL